MAYTLKKSLGEVLELPEWERVAWKAAFEVWGPLDWRRDDKREALNIAVQTGCKLEDCFAFTDLKRREEPTVDDIMKRLGAA